MYVGYSLKKLQNQKEVTNILMMCLHISFLLRLQQVTKVPFHRLEEAPEDCFGRDHHDQRDWHAQCMYFRFVSFYLPRAKSNKNQIFLSDFFRLVLSYQQLKTDKKNLFDISKNCLNKAMIKSCQQGIVILVIICSNWLFKPVYITQYQISFI